MFRKACPTGDEAAGAKIVRRVLMAPLKQIAENAGTSGAVVVRRVRESEDGQGYNALIGEFTEMSKSGVITPPKVERAALQNASEVAILLLTTDCIVTEAPKKSRVPRSCTRGRVFRDANAALRTRP